MENTKVSGSRAVKKNFISFANIDRPLAGFELTKSGHCCIPDLYLYLSVFMLFLAFMTENPNALTTAIKPTSPKMCDSCGY